MSLLPGRILPQTERLGVADEAGNVTIDKNWWLFLYNLGLQTLGTGAGLPADALIDLESADGDALDADAIALRQPISNLAMGDVDLPPVIDTTALLWGQDALLPDPVPQAQPVLVVAVGASPFTYTAPFTGMVAITGGTVSLIQLIRQSATIATGLTAGLIPVSRLDQVIVTHTGAPTMTFLPT